MAIGTNRHIRSTRTGTLAVFLACVVLYGLTAYGGIRSPDNEVVFRGAVSFAERLRLDVDPRMEGWNGFGVALARDSRYYPIFGPAESIVLTPFVLLGRALASAGWSPPAGPPASFYVAGGLRTAVLGEPMRDSGPHTLRLLCSLYNILVGALCALAFLRLARKFSGSEGGALVATAFFAFGSLLWPYTGTFFSEPLAMLFLLLSVGGLIGHGTGSGVPGTRGPIAAMVAGAWLGCAVCTHITAGLFIPFLAALPLLAAGRHERFAALQTTIGYVLGLGAVLSWLGAYDYVRFGSVFETGRTADLRIAEAFSYGTTMIRSRNLYGLLLGPCKGLLPLCPAVLLGLFCWPDLYRRHRAASLVLGAGAAFRVLFMATRSDWHGGFCLGPRYLVVLLPFLLLPIGVATGKHLRLGNRRALFLTGGALILCVTQQAYFCVGEVFSFMHRFRMRGIEHVFRDDRPYLDMSFSPLFGLLKGARGPYLLRDIPLDNVALWLALSAVLAAGVIAGMMALRAAHDGPALRPQAGDADRPARTAA